MGDEQEKVFGIEVLETTQDIPPTKDQQAKEDTLILDCVEDDDVRAALADLHAREDWPTPSQA